MDSNICSYFLCAIVVIHHRYQAITSAYYRGAIGALLAYDISNRKSFEHVQKWLDELRMHADKNMIVMLVGNKCDLSSHRVVSIEEGKDLAQVEDLFFMETSALDSTNVESAFIALLSQIYQKVSKKILFPIDGPETDMGSISLEGTQIDVSKPESQKASVSKKKFDCCYY